MKKDIKEAGIKETKVRIKRLQSDIERTENAELIALAEQMEKRVEHGTKGEEDPYMLRAIYAITLTNMLDDFNAGRDDCQNGVYNTRFRRESITQKVAYDMGWKQENHRMKEYGGRGDETVYVIFESGSKIMKIEDIFGDDKRFTGDDL